MCFFFLFIFHWNIIFWWTIETFVLWKFVYFLFVLFHYLYIIWEKRKTWKIGDVALLYWARKIGTWDRDFSNLLAGLLWFCKRLCSQTYKREGQCQVIYHRWFNDTNYYCCINWWLFYFGHCLNFQNFPKSCFNRLPYTSSWPHGRYCWQLES